LAIRQQNNGTTTTGLTLFQTTGTVASVGGAIKCDITSVSWNTCGFHGAVIVINDGDILTIRSKSLLETGGSGVNLTVGILVGTTLNSPGGGDDGAHIFYRPVDRRLEIWDGTAKVGGDHTHDADVYQYFRMTMTATILVEASSDDISYSTLETVSKDLRTQSCIVFANARAQDNNELWVDSYILTDSDGIGGYTGPGSGSMNVRKRRNKYYYPRR